MTNHLVELFYTLLTILRCDQTKRTKTLLDLEPRFRKALKNLEGEEEFRSSYVLAMTFPNNNVFVGVIVTL